MDIEHLAAATFLLAELSSWAYAEPRDFALVLRRMFQDQATSTPISLKNDALTIDANAYLVEITVDEKTVGVLVFRGTSWESALDWVVNATVEMVQFGDYGRVHGGFLRNVWWLGDEIRTNLETLLSNPRLHSLFITGHSLGGAMAALAAVLLWTNRQYPELRANVQKKLAGVYTFGAPAVGDATFVQQCPRKLVDMTYMHVYENDIVSHLPPWSVGDFRHFGTAYHSADSGWIVGEPLTQTYTAVAANILGFSPLALKLFRFTSWIPPVLTFVANHVPLLRRFIVSWADHSPINYIRCSNISNQPAV